MRAALVAPFDSGRDMVAIGTAIAGPGGGDAFRRVVYTESHDEVANGHRRVPEEIWPGNAGSWFSRKRSTLGAALVFTSPAIPMIFQGQEILEDAWFRDEDPIDWSREQTYAGILRLYRDLIRLRRNADGVTRGLTGHHVNVFHVNDDANVIGFHRWDRGGPGDDVVVVLNASYRAIDGYVVGLPRAVTWRTRFDSDSHDYSLDFVGHPGNDAATTSGPRDGMPQSGSVSVGPYSAIVLSRCGAPRRCLQPT